ncbi:hypothetical protein ACL03H_23050 [Saccharopolyspora sp. MS10]
MAEEIRAEVVADVTGVAVSARVGDVVREGDLVAVVGSRAKERLVDAE